MDVFKDMTCAGLQASVHQNAAQSIDTAVGLEKTTAGTIRSHPRAAGSAERGTAPILCVCGNRGTSKKNMQQQCRENTSVQVAAQVEIVRGCTCWYNRSLV